MKGEQHQPNVDDVNGDGTHWRVTNDLNRMIVVEYRSTTGSRLMVRLPVGGSFDLYPSSPDDANLLMHEVTGPARLSVVRDDDAS